MLKVVEFQMSKDNPSPPLDTFRQVLLANNRFHTVLPRILYDSMKKGIKKPKLAAKGIRKPKTHKCPLCPRMFGSTWNVKRHITGMHSKHEAKE